MKLTLLIIYLIYAALPSFAQNKNYVLNDYKLTISGTSTLHDWECSVNDVNAIVALNTSHETIVGIDTLHVTILSESIKMVGMLHQQVNYFGHGTCNLHCF